MLTRRLSLIASSLAIWVATFGYLAQTYSIAVHTSHHFAEKITATQPAIDPSDCSICDGIQTAPQILAVVFEIRPDFLVETGSPILPARQIAQPRILSFGSRAPPAAPV